MEPDPSQLAYADPTNPQSFNLYSYAYNNPMIYFDPRGLDACAYDNGDGTAAIVNAEDGGAVECPKDGFYITTNQQVTGVGFNGNGDLSVYGADGGLYNPDGSSYNAAQTVSVGANGNSIYSGPPTIYSGFQYVTSQSGPNKDYKSNYPDYGTVFCTADALRKNGFSLALDAVGVLPEGGAVSAAFSLYHGAAGVSEGTSILRRAQFASALVSTAGAASDVSGSSGANSLAGVQAATGAASIGASLSKGLSRAVPGVGQVISAIAVGEDLYGIYSEGQKCH
jgi:hypothetical protein